MRRRRFIALSALSAATITMPFLNCTGSDFELAKILSVPDVLSHICDSKMIIDIGKTYRAKIPSEDTAQKIEDLLAHNTDGSLISSKTSQADIQSLIAKKIHSDFALGKTLMLKGWVLSATEARQSALFSFIHSQ